MPARRLEDRIRELCARALYTQGREWSETVHQLQLAIQEHALRVANLTSAATIGGRRLGSNILGRQGSLTLVQFLHIRFAPGIGTQHTVRTTSCAPKSLASKSNNPKPDARISLRNLLQFFPRGGLQQSAPSVRGSGRKVTHGQVD